MCLHVKTTKPSIAEEDIVCYKVLEYSSIFKEYVTPFRSCPMKIGNTLHDRKDWEFSITEFITGFFLAAGGFHTYEVIADAKHFARELDNSTIVVKCIIPKSTEYFKGWTTLDGYHVRGYASKDLKLIKEVEHYDRRDQDECSEE